MEQKGPQRRGKKEKVHKVINLQDISPLCQMYGISKLFRSESINGPVFLLCPYFSHEKSVIRRGR